MRRMRHGSLSRGNGAGEGDRVTMARRRGGNCSSPLAIVWVVARLRGWTGRKM